MSPATVTRRRVLQWGLGGAAAVLLAGVAGVELVVHDVVPGHAALDRLDGACSVPVTAPSFEPGATTRSGEFFSRARNRRVGYTIAFPPGHKGGDLLPLVVALHGYGGDHNGALAKLSLEQAVSMVVGGRPLAPMAMVAADGGGGYWHAHPGDDPMGMLVDELIPLCQGLGLGRPPQHIGALGTSMGAYGALLLAVRHPGLLAAVATISPAIWTTYSQARAANAGAFMSAEDFAANDVVALAGRLGGMPVRVAAGRDDPFHPGVEALVRALPSGAVVEILPGCHDAAFEASQQPASLAFLAAH